MHCNDTPPRREADAALATFKADRLYAKLVDNWVQADLRPLMVTPLPDAAAGGAVTHVVDFAANLQLKWFGNFGTAARAASRCTGSDDGRVRDRV